MIDYILDYLYGYLLIMFSAVCMVITWSLMLIPAALVWLIVKLIGKVRKKS